MKLKGYPKFGQKREQSQLSERLKRLTELTLVKKMKQPFGLKAKWRKGMLTNRSQVWQHATDCSRYAQAFAAEFLFYTIISALVSFTQKFDGKLVLQLNAIY